MKRYHGNVLYSSGKKAGLGHSMQISADSIPSCFKQKFRNVGLERFQTDYLLFVIPDICILFNILIHDRSTGGTLMDSSVAAPVPCSALL